MPRTRRTKPPDPAAAPRDRLCSLIESDGRTMYKIIIAAGIHKTSLFDITTGRTPNPSLRTVARILAALGKTWKDLDEPA